MTAILLKKVETASTINSAVEVPTNQETELVKLKGELTSNIRTKASTNTPYYAFLKSEDCVNCHNVREICQALTPKHKNCDECAKQKCQECEIPVIFRLKEETKPNFKKGNKVILEGNFSVSKQAKRPSFTCYFYQLLKEGKNFLRYE
ncbi:MAG: hypothetical protein GBAus27B_000418 [Mycoplasmataceae bacterium]|nr:MAG: hypothetical protein GBAus27B_000418 [Mycoplasmataceae bacterium]